MKKLMVLDTEVTGVSLEDGDRLIEIGVVELKNGVVSSNTFHRYYNPETSIKKEATNIHGVTDEFIKKQPLFKDVGNELLTFIGGCQLIVHNEGFDASFINYEIQRSFPSEQLLQDRCNITDTLTLAKALFPNQKCNILALIKRLGVNTQPYKDYPETLKCAAIIGEVYLKLIEIKP